MAADPKISNAAALAACNAIVDLLDAGTPPGLLKIYATATTIPAGVDVALDGNHTLLATLTLGNPAFGNAADANPGGRATAATITDDSAADATGTAAFFRATNAAGTAIIQGTVGTADADLILNSVAIQQNAAVSVTAWTFTIPEG